MNQIAPQQPHSTATAADWSRFLRPIAAAVRNPPSEQDFKARVAALAMAMPTATADILAKQWLQAEAMRKCQFWPSVADLAEIIQPEINDARRQQSEAVAAISYCPPQMRITPTPEEAAEVKAKLDAFMAEMRMSSDGQPKPTVKPAYLSDAALLAMYEKSAAEGNDAAAFRAAALRRKLGA